MSGDGVPYRLQLGESLVIQRIDDILLQLRQALDENDAVDVDCTIATEADASVIQLLLAARLSAQRCQKHLRVFTGDGALLTALEAGGFLTPVEQTGRDPFWIAERR